MKHTIIAFLIVAIPFLGQAKKGNDFSVKGKIENAIGKKIYLENFVQNQPVKIDSAIIDKTGKFELKGTSKTLEFHRLFFDQRNFLLLITTNGENSTVTGDFNDLMNSYSVVGSKESEFVKEFLSGFLIYTNTQNEISKEFNNPETSLVKKSELRKKADSVKIDFVHFRDQYINKHSQDIAVMTTLSHLDDNVDYELIKKIEAGLAINHKGSKYHRTVLTKLQQIEFQIKQAEQAKLMQANSGVGKPAPAMNFPNPDGKVITLESLKGNWVLIDFWASWCGPCRRENPNVVRAYNKYNKKGFTVMSVSLDKDKNRWVNAIKQDGLLWPNHVSDLKQWQSASVQLYGFKGIPHTVLVNPDGIIVEKNLRGAALDNKLVQIFGE